MDQISGGRTGKTEAKSPKHDKYDYNCPKHDFFLLIVLDRFQPEAMAGKVLVRSKAIRGRRRWCLTAAFVAAAAHRPRHLCVLRRFAALITAKLPIVRGRTLTSLVVAYTYIWHDRFSCEC